MVGTLTQDPSSIQEGLLLPSETKKESPFTLMREYHEGYALVIKDKKYNFVNPKGVFISDKWYDFAWDFTEGFAIVCLNEKWNYIGTDGSLLSKYWFDRTYNFSEELGRIRQKGKWNFIRKDGKSFLQNWLNDATDFKDGIAKVLSDKKWWQTIDKKGIIQDEEIQVSED
jgi:hypothetical protein